MKSQHTRLPSASSVTSTPLRLRNARRQLQQQRILVEFLVTVARRVRVAHIGNSAGSLNGLIGLFVFMALLIFGSARAVAQTQCAELGPVKYTQLPNLDGGYDFWDSGPWVLADDFICTNTGPIVDIHLWGSWLNNNVDPNPSFWLGMYDDVPAVTNGPVYIPSHPGTNLIWQQWFGPGQYVQSFWSGDADQFLDPGPPAVMGGESKAYYYCFYPSNPPVQLGTFQQPKFYWLAAYTQPSQGSANLFGWKSSTVQRFDISTHTQWPGGPPPATADWRPNIDLNNRGIDLAFKINTETNQPPPPCCPETNGVKWVQSPQVGQGGYDVNATQNPVHNLILADDFLCHDTGPIADIRLWGSWLQDKVDAGAVFDLSIWSDVPKQTNATGVVPSHPGIQLWEQPFGPGQYNQCVYSNTTEQFYDASLSTMMGGDNTIYYLCFKPVNPFVQRGTANVPTNYWLAVNVRTTAGSGTYFGWHNSARQYNDTAVWGDAPLPAAWTPMADPSGIPLSMAFKVITVTNPCPPLTLTCSADKTVECGPNWSFDPPLVSDPCCGTSYSLTYSDVTNGVCPSIIKRTWIVVDCRGETASCSQTVTVVDTTPPVIYCPTNMTIPCGQPWEFGTPSAYDNCCTNLRVFVLATVTNGLCPQYITRTWAAVDCCNNSNTCSQTVAIVNTTPPVINCSTNKNVECGTNWTFDTPTAYSPCCPNVVVTVVGTYTNAQGPCYAYYTRVWQAVDCCNNTNTCSQTVFVTDTKPPVITCAPNKVVECGSSWTFDKPSAYDDCCGTNVTITVVSTVTNGVCPETQTRTWTATDCCGNRSLCNQTVTIMDTTPPTLVCPSNMVIYTCSSNSYVTWSISSFDACSTVSIVSTPPSGTWFKRSTTNAVHVVATDRCGNTNTCNFTVTVLPPLLTLTYNIKGGTITLTWPDGILQEATSIIGPWSDLPLATSPYTVPATAPQKYYRLRCPQQ